MGTKRGLERNFRGSTLVTKCPLVTIETVRSYEKENEDVATTIYG